MQFEDYAVNAAYEACLAHSPMRVLESTVKVWSAAAEMASVKGYRSIQALPAALLPPGHIPGPIIASPCRYCSRGLCHTYVTGLCCSAGQGREDGKRAVRAMMAEIRFFDTGVKMA